MGCRSPCAGCPQEAPGSQTGQALALQKVFWVAFKSNPIYRQDVGAADLAQDVLRELLGVLEQVT